MDLKKTGNMVQYLELLCSQGADMDNITSRKNAYIGHVRRLSADADYRREKREYLCDGIKTLKEALEFGAKVSSVLWKETSQTIDGLDCEEQYVVPAELFDYASSMKNSPGPLFTVCIPAADDPETLKNAVVLENVQDPGNVGTVIRSANAFNIGAVILTGACADLYNPKTVRATMGAIFRQRVIQLDPVGVRELLEKNGLQLYGAALSDSAMDIRTVKVSNAAVAIGSEGRGLSPEFLNICDGEVIIPMNPDSESLNAGVAAAVVMWEMARGVI